MRLFVIFFLFFSISTTLVADQPLIDWIAKHRVKQQNKSIDFTLPDGVKFIQNIAYGHHTRHKMDVYLPKNSKNAPVIFMVHGGAWFMGDKAGHGVVENKVKHWVSKGFILISVNYRLLPEAGPLKQVKDVAKALAFAQKKVARWGGNSSKFILMGHSAGAHLVSVLATSPQLIRQKGAKPWLGTISIDTAVYDVSKVMENQHVGRFYKKAFGQNQTYWKKISPYDRLKQAGQPFLAICSTRRRDSCLQATHFVKKAHSYAMSATVLPINLAHIAANTELGKQNKYTTTVDNFLLTLDPSINKLLISN